MLLQVPATGMAKKENVVCPAVVLKAVPVSVTTAPGAPVLGEMPVTVGNTSKVNSSFAAALVVFPIVAVTLTGPTFELAGLFM